MISLLLLAVISIQLFLMENDINNKITKLDKKLKSSNSASDIENSFNKISKNFQNYMDKINNRFIPVFDLNKHITEALFNKIDFCLNPQKYYNSLIEDLIIKKQIVVNQNRYEMYEYDSNKINGYFSGFIKKNQNEKTLVLEMKNAIEYYAKKNNITNNKSITVIDIGANIGYNTIIFSKLNYSVIAFEPTEKNYYILRKNVCLNNMKNVMIFNMGFYDQEKICDYYVNNKSYENEIVLCDNIEKVILRNEFYKVGTMNLTKLSNYYPYLIHKKIALIKIDIDGNIEKAMKGGIELILKYHVPFFVIKLNQKYFENYGINPKYFIRLFTDNGYKMSVHGFFPSKYDTLETIIDNDCELFFVYKDYAK